MVSGNQRAFVKWLLNYAWVCGTQFLEVNVPRYGARIAELKKEGVDVRRRICANPGHHHQTRQYEWRIVR